MSQDCFTEKFLVSLPLDILFVHDLVRFLNKESIRKTTLSSGNHVGGEDGRNVGLGAHSDLGPG